MLLQYILITLIFLTSLKSLVISLFTCLCYPFNQPYFSLMKRPSLFAFYWACLLIFLNLRMDYILSFGGFVFLFFFLRNFLSLCFSSCFLPFLCSIFTLLPLASFWSKRLNEAKSFQILHFSTNKLYGLPLVQFIHYWIMVKSFKSIPEEKVAINSTWVNSQFLSKICLVGLSTTVMAIYSIKKKIFYSILNGKLNKLLQFLGHTLSRNFW